MRRKLGALLPLEVAILTAGIDLLARGEPTFHGYAVAREIRDQAEARRLTAHGTLYRALDRLEAAGMLESHLEAASLAEVENRPRRRLYCVTAAGARALELAAEPVSAMPAVRREGMAPS